MKNYVISQWSNSDRNAFFDKELQPTSFVHWLTLVNKVKQHALLQPAQIWLVSHSNSFYFSIAWLGLLAAGKTTLLPPNSQHETLLELESNYDKRLLKGELESILNQSFLNTPEELAIEANAQCLFFTSGSSGKPKCVVKNFSQLMVEVQQINQLWPANKSLSSTGSNEVYLSTVSHQHIYGLLFRLLWPLYIGKPIYTPLIEYPEVLETLVQSNKIDRYTLISSPAFIQRLQDIDLNCLAQQQHKITRLFSSGGPLSFSAAQQVTCSLKNSPLEIFGSTETGGIAYRTQQQEHESWQTFPNISIRCDEHQRMSIKSPYLPDESNNTQTENWYLCDDRIEQVSEHHFRLLSRADRVIKIEEKRISLNELENQLQKHTFIVSAKTLLIPGRRKQIAALIQLNQQGQLALKKLGKLALNRLFRAHMMNKFEAIVLPRKWRYTDQIPYNEQGKLSQQVLLGLFKNKISKQP